MEHIGIGYTLIGGLAGIIITSVALVLYAEYKWPTEDYMNGKGSL